MPDETAPVVSGAMETPTSVETPSSTDTQTSSESTPSTEAPENATAQEKTDWRKKAKEDPELGALLNAERQSAIAKARQKWERQNAKLTAKDIAEKEDVEAALEYVRAAADAPDDDDEDGPSTTGESPVAKYAALFTAKGIQNTPEYKALYEADKDSVAKAYQSKSVAEFEHWVRTEGFNTSVSKAVQAELKKQLPDLSEARALELTNKALQNVPIPLGGGGAATGGMTYDMLQAMNVSERNAFKRDKPAQYDALVQRATRG